MAEKATEGLTLPADPKENKANIAHEKMRMKSREERLGKDKFKAEQANLEKEEAHRASVMDGADLTDEQKDILKEAKKDGDEVTSDTITGSTQEPADTTGRIETDEQTTRAQSGGSTASSASGPSANQPGSPS